MMNRSVGWLLIGAGAVILSPIAVARGLAGKKSKGDPAVLRALEPVREVLQKSSVVVTDGKGKSLCYGLIVTSTGELLTKASVLEGKSRLPVRVDRKRYEAVLLAESREWDIALFQIQGAPPFSPVEWSDQEVVSKGTIVVSNAATSLLRRRGRLGVISAEQRAIKGPVAALPMLLSPRDDQTLEVREVLEASSLAGQTLQVEDVILSIDGQKVENREDLEALALPRWPGDQAELTIQRRGQVQKVVLTYVWRHHVFEGPADRNEAMSGRLSGRRSGFPLAMQHDTPLSSRTVGGPLLSLSGECLGMNIARASRAETYALPAARVQDVWRQLRAQRASSIEMGQ